MAGRIERLLVKIGADTKELDRASTRVQATLGAIGTKAAGIGKLAAGIGVGFVALGSAAGVAGYAVLRVGSAVEETESKFRTTFGAASESVERFVDDFATMAGLTDRVAKDFLATTGAVAQGMGYTQAASADLARAVLSLAGDFASFNNLPTAETLRAVQSAIVGEFEPLKRLGIVLRASDVQARAMADSGAKNAKALTQQQKAAATLALIQERAGVQVGDLARTQDSAANTAKRLEARLLNLRDAAASALLPALAGVLDVLDESTGGMDELNDRIRASAPVVTAWGKVAVRVFLLVVNVLRTVGRTAFELGQIIGRSLDIAFQSVRAAGASILTYFQRQVNVILGAIDRIPGVELAFRFDTTEANAGVERIKVQAEGIRSDWASIDESVQRSVDSWVDVEASLWEVRRASELVRLEQERIRDAAEDAADTVGAGGGELTGRLGQLQRELKEFKPDLAGVGVLDPERAVKPIKLFARESSRLLGVVRQDAIGLASSAVDALLEFRTEGTAAFRAWAADALKQIGRVLARFLVFKAIAGLLPGSSFTFGLGQAFGFLGARPGLQHGGPIFPGELRLVGERGPELLATGSAGQIVSSRDLASAAGAGGDLHITLVAEGGRRVVDRLRIRLDRDARLDYRPRIPVPAQILTGEV